MEISHSFGSKCIWIYVFQILGTEFQTTKIVPKCVAHTFLHTALSLHQGEGVGRWGIKQFSQSYNPVSCPRPHNLHHSGGHSERDSLTAERTESPSVCQPHPQSPTQRCEGLPSVWLWLRYHSRKWLWVMKETAWVFGFLSLGFALCESMRVIHSRKQH